MSLIRIPTHFNIELEFEAPEFYKRLFAILFDFVIQYIYLVLAIKLYAEFLYYDLSENSLANIPFMLMIILTPAFLYHLVCELALNGQSLGKKLFRIQVVNETGGREGISQILIRFLLNPVNYGILSLYYRSIIWVVILFIVADLVVAIVTRKNQRIGDLLAHTILIKTNPSGNVNDSVFMEVADNYVPVFPQIMQLSDRDINSVKSILDRSLKKRDHQLAAMAAEKIKAHLSINSSLPPFEFLQTVMKDYNYFSTK